MDAEQKKVKWQGEVVSIQPRSTVWRYLIDNRTHRECGYNIFLKGEARSGPEFLHHDSGSDKYDFCVAISEKQEDKLKIRIGDVLKGTGWTKKYPEIEFADYYRAALENRCAVARNIRLARGTNAEQGLLEGKVLPVYLGEHGKRYHSI